VTAPSNSERKHGSATRERQACSVERERCAAIALCSLDFLVRFALRQNEQPVRLEDIQLGRCPKPHPLFSESLFFDD